MELEHNWNGRPYHSLDWDIKYINCHWMQVLPVPTGTAPVGPGDAFSAAKAVPEILRKA